MKTSILTSLVIFAVSLPVARAERRVALVIGNASYEQGALNNTLRDAAGMSDTLRTLQFEVISTTDASREQMIRAINNFGEKIKTSDVSLFYFSGHGLQSKGNNYLAPIGAKLTSEADIELEMVDANRILAKMDAARTGVNIVILDCCRNDPFARGFRSTGSGGLAALDAPRGTIVAYATAPGTVASDGVSGGYGLYTGHLLAEMRKPGITIERMFKNVRLEVTRKRPQQVPWESSSLTGEFLFVPAKANPAGIPTAPPSAEWSTYTNGRFGCSIPVPPGMVAARPPENSGGQEFATPDGKVRLAVGGYFNINEEDLVTDRYQSLIEDKDTTITYRKKTRDWFAVSGFLKDGTGFYEKFTANKHYASGWRMTYPQSQDSIYAPMIERIAKGYRANLGGGADTIE